MVDEHILQRVEELRKTASPHEAKHLHSNLITLLKRGRSNKMSPVVKSVLRQKPGRVLDVGCGYGALAIFFAIQGIETTGIDVDQEALKAGNRLAAELGITNITLTPMDACAISLCGFDMALSTDFYEHLAYEHQLMHLRSVWQALKPGGVYVIRAPHRHNIRQQRGDHIGLPSFAGLLHQAEKVGFKVRFNIAHTDVVAPFNYHVPLERWLETRKWSALALYKGLQKSGLANVLARLEKQLSRLDKYDA